MAGSLRAGSHNGRLAALVAKELTLVEADVTRISLADYPLALLDADLLADSGPPDNAVKLKQMLSAHQGLFIASPEYTASVTPLLKNAIDWITRVRERKKGRTLRSRIGCLPWAGLPPMPTAACTRSWRCGRFWKLVAARWFCPNRVDGGKADRPPVKAAQAGWGHLRRGGHVIGRSPEVAWGSLGRLGSSLASTAP